MGDFGDFNCAVKITGDCEEMFFGKSSTEILKNEFAGFLYREPDNYKYIAEIPSGLPLANKEILCSVVLSMREKGYKCAVCGKVVIYEKNYADEKPAVIENDYLNADCSCAKNIVFITETLRQRINQIHIENGVLILNPQSVYIDFDSKIENGVKIYQNNMVCGKSVIKSGCVLMPGNNIDCCEICENVTVSASTLKEAFVGSNTTVGPNAYLRPQAKIGENCRIGDFVEIKNASIGNGTKVSHLSYVGDADVGGGCNIGCGVVFVNYNGRTKSRSRVGNNSFIGSNCNIIAPVEIGDGVFVAAGTTVVKNLPSDAFCIGRAHEDIKENRAHNYLGGHKD